MVSSHDASKRFVHQVLYDQIVGRADNATEYHRRSTGDDAGLCQITAEGRETKFDSGRALAQPSHDRRRKNKLDIAVRRNGDRLARFRRIELLLAEDHL